jgi:hypothetical protein
MNGVSPSEVREIPFHELGYWADWLEYKAKLNKEE